MALFLERFNLMCFTFLREAIKSFLPVENHFINPFYKTLLEMHFSVSSKQVYENGFTK